MRLKFPFAIVTLLFGLGVLPVCASAQAPSPQAPTKPRVPDHIVHHGSQVMGTVVDLTIWTDNEAGAAEAAKAVFEEFQRVDRLMSSWLEDSAVAKINRGAGTKAIVVDEEVMKLVLRAHQAGKLSGGAFDISVGSFRGLWKFDQDIDGSIPADDKVQERAKLVDYRKIALNKKRRSVKLRRKGMRITLGGVAKGYAVDQAVAIMHKRGFVDFIVQAGGDLYASGRRGDRSWRVGIRDPRGNRDASFALAEVSNQTFSTSGDYERSIVVKGVRYHHILDPATGRPAKRSRSVTVLAPDALTADIWSTALFVIGPENGMKIVESRDDMEAVFVDENNALHISTGLQDKLRILKPPSPGI